MMTGNCAAGFFAYDCKRPEAVFDRLSPFDNHSSVCVPKIQSKNCYINLTI